MDLDIDDFKERLRKQLMAGNSGADYISQEVHKAETLKVGLVEEIDHAEDFVTEASNKIDTYVAHLHDLAKQYPLADFPPDQRTALQDQKVQAGIQQQIEKLEDAQDPDAEGNISPLDLS